MPDVELSTPAAEPAATSEPVATPPESSPITPEATSEAQTTPLESAETAPPDPNDPYSLLQAAMDKEFGATEAAPEAETPQTPAEFARALEISQFVKSPEHVEAAIRAADEVWKVSTGEVPASQLLEGMRQANPQQYESILTNLAQYIEQVSGLKFGQPGQTTPPDPREQRLAAIEKRFQQEEQARQEAVQQQQLNAAAKVANEFVANALKGTFAEGNEAHFLAMCASKSKLPEGEMVRELLAGNTKPLETALKAVRAEETARLKAYNDRLAKKYRALQSAVPATKSTPLQGQPKDDGYLPGETVVQRAMRLWNSGNAA